MDAGLFGEPLSSSLVSQETKLHELSRSRAGVGRVSATEKRLDRLARVYEHETPPATAEETSFRHSGWAGRRAAVLSALTSARVGRAALCRFRECGSGCRVEHSPETGDWRLSAYYCHSRWCVPCARARSRSIAAVLSGLMGDRVSRNITLTLKHSHAPLSEQIDHLVRSFAKLRRHKFWLSAVRAGAYFVELKRSACGQFWHPHIHIVIQGYRVDVAELREAWRTATGGSYVVWIERAREKNATVSYAAKYAAKGVDNSCFAHPDWLVECVRALHGRRLCGTFGEWRGVELEGGDSGPSDWRHVTSLTRLVRAARDGEEWALGLAQSLLSASKLQAVLSNGKPADSPAG